MNTREKLRTLDITGRCAAGMLLIIMAVSAVITVACGPVRPPAVPTLPPVAATRYVRATVRGAGQLVTAPGTARLRLDSGQAVDCAWDVPHVACALLPEMPAPFGANLRIDLEGFRAADTRVVLQDFASAGADQYLSDIDLERAGFDPSTVPLEQLARIRGAMWTETLPVALGPRPWQPTNIAATDFLWNYSESDRAAIVQNLRALGYTHAVVGPLVDSDGYHGAWQPNDWRGKWDQFLDQLQYLWDAGLAPIVFIHPDNWTLEQTKELTPLLQQPRAQRLIRIVVPAGWEPVKYEWSNATWIEFEKWGRETLPNALVLIHTVCDVDAPVGTDSRGDDNGRLANADGWARIAPYLHGWLTQSCTYERKDGVDANGRSNFLNWVDLFNPSAAGSYANRFQRGYAGWPTSSAWGQGQPLKVYAGEYLAYWVFWQGVPKEEARKWGDAAMRAGAAGYLDGGSLPVGDGPVPWQVGR